MASRRTQTQPKQGNQRPASGRKQSTPATSSKLSGEAKSPWNSTQKQYEQFDLTIIKRDLEKDLERLLSNDENKDVTCEIGENAFKLDKFIIKARCPTLYSKIDDSGKLIKVVSAPTLASNDTLSEFFRSFYTTVDVGRNEINKKATKYFQLNETCGEDTDEIASEADKQPPCEADNQPVKNLECQVETGCCPLGSDLLTLLDDKETSDLMINISGDEILVHRQLLATRSSYFEAMLHGDWSESEKMIINLKNVSYKGVVFVLKFIYGGFNEIPDDVSDREILQIADMYGLDLLKDIISHYVRQKYCHNFHKPCSRCIPGVLDVAQLSWTFGSKELYNDCIRWIRRHYSKVFVSKEFLRLRAEIQNDCKESVIGSLTPSSVIERLKECEAMEANLPNVKSTEALRVFTKDLERQFFSYLVQHLDHVVTTPVFLDILKGIGWSDSLLEKIVAEIKSSLTINNCCASLTCIQRVMKSIDMVEAAASTEGKDSPFSIEAKDRILEAEKNCFVFIGRNLRSLHNKAAWKELDEEIKQKIKKDAGFFDLNTAAKKQPLKKR